MNLLDGYRVMLNFLESYYWKTKADELGGLLGSMSLLSDNTPADPAFEDDWKEAVSQIVGQSKVDALSSDNVYWAMVTFLRNWAALGTDGTISELCYILEMSSSNIDDWQNALSTVTTGNDDPYLRLLK